MKVLKQNVVDTFAKMNQSWVDEVKKAEETGSIDLTTIVSAQSTFFAVLDKYFAEAEQRLKNNKKGFFG